MKLHPDSRGRRIMLAAAIFTAAALGLSACGGGAVEDTAAGPPVAIDAAAWDAVVEAAKKEGSLNLYISLGGADDVIADFEEAYPGIKVTQNFAPTADLIQKLDQEIDAGVRSADVAMHASPAWFTDRYEADVLSALSVAPAVEEEDWLERLDEKSYATVFGFPYTISSSGGKKAFSDVQSLLKANPDAKIGLNDPHVSIAAAFSYETLRQTFGDEILDQLGDANYVVSSGNTAMAQALAAGSLDYAVPGQASTSAPLIAKGAPIVETVPTKAITGAYYNVASLRSAPHPNAAQVFVNWTMSREGAESFVEHISPATVPLDVEGAIPWGDVLTYDSAVWTNDYWNQWIAEHWTPRFGG